MNKSLRLCGLLFIIFSQSGCASYFKRKACEETNWFEHGHKVAMSGKRLDADNFIGECQKVKANFSFSQADLGFKAGMAAYCSDENVFKTGKNGENFSYELCDGKSQKKMQLQYEKGLEVFCLPTNGYRFGLAGSSYGGVCPKETEETWLTEYRKGRKIYLFQVAENKEREIRRLQNEIILAQTDLNRLLQNQLELQRSTTTRREVTVDPATGRYQERMIQEPDQAAKDRADLMDFEIRNKGRDIADKQKQMEALSEEISKLRTEIATL